jgi:hypothetical protein
MKKILGVILLTATILQAQYSVNGINQGGTNGYTVNSPFKFDTTATQLFARFTTQPSLQQKIWINEFIVEAKTSGWWQTRDTYYFTVPFIDTLHVKLNWIKDSCNATNSNGHWAMDTGYVGNGSNSVLNTNYNLTSNKVHWTRDSGSISYYSSSYTYRNGQDAMFGAQGGFKTHQLWSGSKYYVSTGDGDFNQYFPVTPKSFGSTTINISDSTRLYNFNQDDSTFTVVKKDIYGAVNSNMGIGAILTGSTPSYSALMTFQEFDMGGTMTVQQIKDKHESEVKLLQRLSKIFQTEINIFFIGNSHTFGTGSTNDSSFVKLITAKLGTGYSIYNKGIFGETDSGLYLRYTSEVKPYYNPYRINWYFYWEGCNSINHDSPPDTCLVRENRNITRAKLNGFDKTVHVTVMNGDFEIENYNALRIVLNDLIINNSTADYVLDICLDEFIGCNDCYLNPEYFVETDFIHLKNKGHNRVYELIYTTYFQ